MIADEFHASFSERQRKTLISTQRLVATQHGQLFNAADRLTDGAKPLAVAFTSSRSCITPIHRDR